MTMLQPHLDLEHPFLRSLHSEHQEALAEEFVSGVLPSEETPRLTWRFYVALTAAAVVQAGLVAPRMLPRAH